MSALAFINAGMLVALAALPVIWYFLRLMPPKPRLEQFPPTRLLLELARKEEQPSHSPWWLTAIRLGLAAAVILALAGPIFKPTGEVAPGDGPLLLVVDNDWTAAPAWAATLETAHRVVGLADDAGRPIALMATAEPSSQSLTPTDATEIRSRLDALTPRPWTADRGSLVGALREAAQATSFGGAAWLSDGVGGADVDTFAAALSASVAGPIVAYVDGARDIVGLKPAVGDAEALKVPVVRRAAAVPAAGIVRASDIRGRVIGETPYTFEANAATAEASFALPVELRNDIVRLEIAGVDTAGAVQLLDDRWQRRRIGLLSGSSAESAQPLLSPLYYIARAVQPFADVVEPNEANAALAIPELIEGGASLIVMADIGNLAPDVEEQVANWVDAGGTLVRFAGPRLAAASDSLIPVMLRHGDRVLGGSLSWQTPQPLATLSGPFSGLTVPEDVLVRRQVLAEPDGTLADRTWATLGDGTPLVTAAQSGRGWLILFHITADTSWSNLPLSGTFVDMLRRIIAFSTSVGGTGSGGAAAQPVPPYRLLDGYGRFTAPTAEAEALSGDLAEVQPGLSHPPGLYGSEEGFRALNLLNDTAEIAPFDIAGVENASVQPYPTSAPTPLAPWLIALAILLLAADAIAVLWLNGGLRWPNRRQAATAATIALGAAFLFAPGGALRADEASDRFAMEAVDQTRLAYVITGDPEVDATSRAGLWGLSLRLADRTALEPGDPVGVDPATDELAFFPLIYWPIVPDGDLPSSATMSRIDAYMRQGGSVLFDTRDQLERSTTVNSNFGGTPAAERLREMLANLDIPPLEPVPADHVLTKAFYLLNDFPGRYAGGPLWVQASDTEERTDRPAQAGDGVSTILITENDFAGAWAVDESRQELYPTVPADPLQREMAYRAGVNIVMYTLTGNYKADQVHVPALLERLGQ